MAWSPISARKVMSPTSLSKKLKRLTRNGQLFVQQGKDETHHIWVMWHINLQMDPGFIIWRCDRCPKIIQMIDWNGLSEETLTEWCNYFYTRTRQGEGGESDWTFNLGSPSVLIQSSKPTYQLWNIVVSKSHFKIKHQRMDGKHVTCHEMEDVMKTGSNEGKKGKLEKQSSTGWILFSPSFQNSAGGFWGNTWLPSFI